MSVYMSVCYDIYLAPWSSFTPTYIPRHYLQGVDMTISDYDGRTALHLAAAEGQEAAVKFLLETCQVPPNPKDR